MNCITTKFFGLLWFSQHRAYVKKIIGGYHLFVHNYHLLKYKKNPLLILTFLGIFSIFELEVRVFDELYGY